MDKTSREDYLRFIQVCNSNLPPSVLKFKYLNYKVFSIYRKGRKHYLKKHRIRTLYYKYLLNRFSNKFGITVSVETEIGPGIVFFHTGSLVISNQAIIGRNASIGPNVLIGLDFNEKRFGAPTIGDDVFIGNNTTIVGRINIGNNVTIAPNSFVNFDVPDNCVVIGSPGTIHKKK